MIYMTSINTNITDYTLSELMAIVEVEQLTPEEIIENTNYYIRKYNAKNPKLAVFFKEIQSQLLQYAEGLDPESDEEDDTDDSTNTSVTLKWKYPFKPNGVIDKYVLNIKELDAEIIIYFDYKSNKTSYEVSSSDTLSSIYLSANTIFNKSISYGVTIWPLYFPGLNSYVTSVYKIYHSFLALLFFHFEDVLQMAILLHKMKLFSPFVKKYFSKSPQFISLSQKEVEDLQMSSIHNRPTTSRELLQVNQREKIERKIEKNMLYMALTLCSMSILSRFIFMIGYVYYFLFNTFSNSLTIGVVSYFIFTFGPTVSIFVFYSFNNTFRDELNKRLRFWKN